MMLSISWQMTIISLIILPIAGLLVKIIVGKSQGFFQKQQAYLATVNGQVEEIYGGLNIVKVFNGENKVIKAIYKPIKPNCTNISNFASNDCSSRKNI